jgi:hypothetical protein
MSIIYPLILEGGPEFKMSDLNFADLERIGEISLSAELRQRLYDIAHLWVCNLTGLQSPRPKQFRKRLKQIEGSLEKAALNSQLESLGALIRDPLVA